MISKRSLIVWVIALSAAACSGSSSGNGSALRFGGFDTTKSYAENLTQLNDVNEKAASGFKTVASGKDPVSGYAVSIATNSEAVELIGFQMPFIGLNDLKAIADMEKAFGLDGNKRIVGKSCGEGSSDLCQVAYYYCETPAAPDFQTCAVNIASVVDVASELTWRRPKS